MNILTQAVDELSEKASPIKIIPSIKMEISTSAKSLYKIVELAMLLISLPIALVIPPLAIPSTYHIGVNVETLFGLLTEITNLAGLCFGQEKTVKCKLMTMNRADKCALLAARFIG